MKADLASGSWKYSSYTIQGDTFTTKSWDEFRRMLDYVKVMADAESKSHVGRTYAKNGGRA